LLLIGEGGAGKSTVTLHCLLQEMELVAEDAVFIEPQSLLASGVGSFLHVREDSLEFVRHTGDDIWIRKLRVIRRRSGVEKFELDLRRTHYRIAPMPLKIVGVVFLSTERGDDSLLVSLTASDRAERLAATQSYAANQPGWPAFLQHLGDVGAFELRRGRHPSEAVQALQGIIEQAVRTRS
jgi:hypothetical protein